MSAAWFIVRLIERVGVSPRPGSLRYSAGRQNWRRGGLMATREEEREERDNPTPGQADPHYSPGLQM